MPGVEMSTLTKISLLPDILKAATLLYECGIIKVPAADCVKLFVKKNPDIQQYIDRAERIMYAKPSV